MISFKVIPNERGAQPKIKLEGREGLVLLSSLGEGINRYISILCAVWASHDGYLFIDEIENGIHFSNYKKLWQLIFIASQQTNCLVFVTTHSRECVTAFNEVQQEQSIHDSNYYELYKSIKKQQIAVNSRDTEQLKFVLEHNEAFRGE